MTLAWHFPDERSPAHDAIDLRAVMFGTIVPAHWHMEVANGLLMGERRKKTTLDLTARFLTKLEALPIEVDVLKGDAAFVRILPLARAHGLTVYDAIYLELAERRALPLATLDDDLAAATRAVGLEVLQ